MLPDTNKKAKKQALSGLISTHTQKMHSILFIQPTADNCAQIQYTACPPHQAPTFN